MSIPVYVVNDEDLVSLDTVGHGNWDGTTHVVTYADHVAALAEEYKRGCTLARGEAIEHYQQGHAAALSAARDAVGGPACNLAAVRDLTR